MVSFDAVVQHVYYANFDLTWIYRGETNVNYVYCKRELRYNPYLANIAARSYFLISVLCKYNIFIYEDMIELNIHFFSQILSRLKGSFTCKNKIFTRFVFLA